MDDDEIFLFRIMDVLMLSYKNMVSESEVGIDKLNKIEQMVGPIFESLIDIAQKQPPEVKDEALEKIMSNRTMVEHWLSLKRNEIEAEKE